MDNGEVIPGLNEDWTFAGAKAMEWGSGVVMMMMTSELAGLSPAKAMPIMLSVLVGTTFGLAALRKMFPDEERGVANLLMTNLGICPPNIPAPAALQPLWSGTPMKELQEKKEFVDLGLLDVFPNNATLLQEEEEEEEYY
ncbi:MAG: hypothetical protein KDD64_09265 [Bdellovibrionales bacterium]|nr:hypothetical protein [Bdellovibrionales bacterium]